MNGNVLIDATEASLTGDTMDSMALIAIMDVGPNSDPINIDLLITQENDPTTLAPTPQSMNEDTTLVLNETMLGLNDEEGDTNIHYVVTSAPNVSGITLVANGNVVSDGQVFTQSDLDNGLVSINAEGIDLPTDTTVIISLQAIAQNGPPSLAADLIINIVAVNDQPTVSVNDVTVAENVTTAIPSGALTYTDEELDALLHYEIVSTLGTPEITLERTGEILSVGSTFTQADLDAGRVQINTTDIDISTNTTDSIVVIAVMNNGANSAPTTLNVTILPDDDEAQLTTAAMNIVENQAQTLNANSLTVTDEEGDNLQYFEITALPGNENIIVLNNGTELGVGDTFTQAEINAGQITIDASDADFSGAVSASDTDALGLIAVMNAGPNSAEEILTLNLVTQNDPPQLNEPQSLQVNENATLALPANLLTFTDEEGDNLAVFVVEQLPGLNGVSIDKNGVPMQVNSSFTLQELNSGVITVNASALELSTAISDGLRIHATTTDGDISNSVAITIEFSPANDAPQLVQGINLPTITGVLSEPVPATAFIDSDGDTLSYTALQADNSELPAWLEFNPSSRQFSLLSAAAAETLNVRVIADDGNGGQAFALVTLNFAPPDLGAATPDESELDNSLEPVIVNNPAVSLPDTAPNGDNETDEGKSEESNSDAAAESEQNAEDESSLNVDIESERIDLASLLPALQNSSDSESSRKPRNSSSIATRAELLGLTDIAESLDPFSLSAFESSVYQRELAGMAERWDRTEQLNETLLNVDTVVGSSVGVSSGFTVGYMIWLLRGGTLMGSVLSSLPAWRLVDPLPVLAELDDDYDDEDESLESIVDND